MLAKKNENWKPILWQLWKTNKQRKLKHFDWVTIIKKREEKIGNHLIQINGHQGKE